jgi:hypothetical protein
LKRYTYIDRKGYKMTAGDVKGRYGERSQEALLKEAPDEINPNGPSQEKKRRTERVL